MAAFPSARVGGRDGDVRAAVNPSAQAASYFGEAGIGADLVLLVTGSTGDADATEYFVANLDWYAATNGDDGGVLSR